MPFQSKSVRITYQMQHPPRWQGNVCCGRKLAHFWSTHMAISGSQHIGHLGLNTIGDTIGNAIGNTIGNSIQQRKSDFFVLRVSYIHSFVCVIYEQG